MGMFDEINVGRTYLKDLLTKEQEKVLKVGDDMYQTKSLENALYNYRVYRRKLWQDDSSFSLSEKKDDKVKKPNWVWVKKNLQIEFYTEVIENGNSHWFEFAFTFVDGKIDTKELTDYSTRSKAELDKEEEEWAIIKTYYDAYKKKTSVRLFDFLGNMFMRLSTRFNRRCTVPEEIKKEAYKAAGKEYKCFPDF
jgi:hypothetical protein